MPVNHYGIWEYKTSQFFSFCLLKTSQKRGRRTSGTRGNRGRRRRTANKGIRARRKRTTNRGISRKKSRTAIRGISRKKRRTANKGISRKKSRTANRGISRKKRRTANRGISRKKRRTANRLCQICFKLQRGNRKRHQTPFRRSAHIHSRCVVRIFFLLITSKMKK